MFFVTGVTAAEEDFSGTNVSPEPLQPFTETEFDFLTPCVGPLILVSESLSLELSELLDLSFVFDLCEDWLEL